MFFNGQAMLRKRNILVKNTYLNQKNVWKNVFEKAVGDITKLCRVKHFILGIIPVSSFSYPRRTVYACAVKLVDGNISKECIKGKHN